MHFNSILTLFIGEEAKMEGETWEFGRGRRDSGDEKAWAHVLMRSQVKGPWALGQPRGVWDTGWGWVSSVRRRPSTAPESCRKPLQVLTVLGRPRELKWTEDEIRRCELWTSISKECYFLNFSFCPEFDKGSSFNNWIQNISIWLAFLSFVFIAEPLICWLDIIWNKK